ncbi:GreA/GreB family elongation factor [Xylanivirga thermophila]|uniref:GreA/GreB family elongation factor n=1 Tax=Xylanivirga thermophila TaxID=2496273 RepID=UPI0013EA666E|nr:GreA/GreB family elongation factor [Xylanivirga thermophila]
MSNYDRLCKFICHLDFANLFVDRQGTYGAFAEIYNTSGRIIVNNLTLGGEIENGVRHMQGVPAHLEYIHRDENTRRYKKRCIYFDKYICKCNKSPNYMCKCYSPTICMYYREKDENSRDNKTSIAHNYIQNAYQKNQPSDKININCKVKLYDFQYKEHITIYLVELKNKNVSKHKISIDTPLGKELIGKDVNDIIEIETEKAYRYKIVSWDKIT